MPRSTLPWLLPLGLVIGVVVLGFAGNVVLGLLAFALWVGAMFAYAAYARTRAEQRQDRTPSS